MEEFVKWRGLKFQGPLYMYVAVLNFQAGLPHSLLMALAVFTVFPLEFVAMVEITKEVPQYMAITSFNVCYLATSIII